MKTEPLKQPRKKKKKVFKKTLHSGQKIDLTKHCKLITVVFHVLKQKTFPLKPCGS